MILTKIRLQTLLLLLVTVALGCSSDSYKTPVVTPVEVVVKLNGQPLPNAVVMFTPTDSGYGANAIATGVTDESGRAVLAVGSKPGATVGENRVTINEAGPDEEARGDSPEAQMKATQQQRALKNRPIPTKYATVAESDLKVEVKSGEKDYTLELKR